jgi:hypothetical protein
MRNLTIVLNTASTPKKNSASIAVMIITMIAVVTVSLRVGQTTLEVSARTCRMNSPGETFATWVQPWFEQ